MQAINTVARYMQSALKIKAIVMAGTISSGIDIVMLRRCRLKEYGVKVYRIVCTKDSLSKERSVVTEG